VQRKIYVMLDPREAGALLDLCQREDRYPQQQAARLIREGLTRAGALPADQSATDSRPAAAVEAVT